MVLIAIAINHFIGSLSWLHFLFSHSYHIRYSLDGFSVLFSLISLFHFWFESDCTERGKKSEWCCIHKWTVSRSFSIVFLILIFFIINCCRKILLYPIYGFLFSKKFYMIWFQLQLIKKCVITTGKKSTFKWISQFILLFFFWLCRVHRLWLTTNSACKAQQNIFWWIR